MENCKIVSTKSAGCGRIREMVAHTRGGRTWRFDHVFCRLFYKCCLNWLTLKTKLNSCVAHSVCPLGSRGPFSEKNPLAPRVLQCTALYSIKHRPRSNAADRSKITNKRRPRKNAAPIRRMRRLLENNKKNLSTTW